MSHTPGAWEVREREWKDQLVISQPGGTALALVLRQRRMDGTPGHDAEANARLIVAAPLMLEACKMALDHPLGYVREKIEAAIATAEPQETIEND